MLHISMTFVFTVILSLLFLSWTFMQEDRSQRDIFICSKTKNQIHLVWTPATEMVLICIDTCSVDCWDPLISSVWVTFPLYTVPRNSTPLFTFTYAFSHNAGFYDFYLNPWRRFCRTNGTGSESGSHIIVTTQWCSLHKRLSWKNFLVLVYCVFAATTKVLSQDLYKL